MIQKNASVWESSNIQTELQLSAIVVILLLPAKTNMASIGMSLWSVFITGWGKQVSIVLFDLDPHNVPLD